MLKQLFKEIGQTVRHALGSSDRTVRLCLIMIIGAGILIGGSLLLLTQTSKV